MSAPVQIGDVIAGKYRVERVLGEGGMGIVVAATHLELEQLVALKFLLPEAFANLEAIQRFMREARAAAKIRSEHVARILDTGRLDNGSPYQVMEFLEGDDLSRVLEVRQSLSVDEAVSFILQASEALAEAHAAGIVHRDLKPANLFLSRKADRSQIIKVLDFGISKNISSSGSSASPREAALTKSNAIVGSPYYMSPEQLTYGRPVDARSDIWALGVILYEMLSGTPPFGGETLPQIVAGILSNHPRPIADLRPDVPPPVAAAIGRCMRSDPDERFPSVADLGAAIAPYGPPGSRESADTMARVLGVSLGAGFVATMADYTNPGMNPGVPSYGASSASVSRPFVPAVAGSATADPWSRSGTAAPAAEPRKVPAIAIVAVLGTLVGVLGVVGVGAYMGHRNATAAAGPDANPAEISASATVVPSVTTTATDASSTSAPPLDAGALAAVDGGSPVAASTPPTPSRGGGRGGGGGGGGGAGNGGAAGAPAKPSGHSSTPIPPSPPAPSIPSRPTVPNDPNKKIPL